MSDKKEIMHWADQIVENIIHAFKDKTIYTCACGISPSGTIHFGNFRETITTDLVVKALENQGKKVNFIYSWDDFDRFRKVPNNVPKEFEKYIGMPYIDIPDPFNCHKNYAEHFESEYEKNLPILGITPKFIYQNKQYQSCKYAEEIKAALKNREAIRQILNKYRKYPLGKDWYPLTVYCEACKKDSTIVTSYDEKYTVEYKCECKHKGKVNFKEKGIVKLPWRIDWPMRWHFEGVDFEPSGKEHSTPGGSRTTADLIVEAVWKRKPPVHRMYDFIILKGEGGKMSGSLGNIISLRQVLDIYEPEIIRFMFAGTRPKTEFFVSFDLDVLKVYEDFDKCERIYFNKDLAKNDKDYMNKKRIYELSAIGEMPKEQPLQPSFRHLKNLIQIYNNDADVEKYYKKEIKNDFDLKRLQTRTACAKNWLKEHAPEDMKFQVQDKITAKLSDNEKKALLSLTDKLKKNNYNEKTLFDEFYSISKKEDLEPKDFFKAAYKALINQERGPKLAPFILILGKDKVIELLSQLKQ